MKCAQLALLIALLPVHVASAREYAPRVVSPHRADAYSMRTFAQFPRWKNLQQDALAWEVYKYLVDTRSGVFHMNEVLEGSDALSEYRLIRDPVKILNVYGYAFCGILGPVMAGVSEDMGLGPARTLSLPGWNHVASESFYGGRWHYLDLDVRAVFRRDSGSLASMAEAREDASLWRARGPLFFPNDTLDSARRIYATTPVHHYHGFNQSGHTLDFVLRQGETFTRWWTPQGGRWNHPADYNRVDWLIKLLEQEPRGPKPNHRHFTVHNHGNGRFVYRPNLTTSSTDFADGAYDARNLRPSPMGLTLQKSGEGYATFEVRSPYVIVPLVGQMQSAADDREASVAEIDARGAAVAISLDGGLSWQDVAVAAWPARLDLTRYASGRYGYLLKISLRGQPEEAVLRSLTLTTWVQVAPAALPALGAGVNHMEYRVGDHYGLRTRVAEIQSDAGNPAEFLKYLVEAPADYQPQRKTDRVHGAAVVELRAAPGAKIAWFTAEGSFRTHQGDGARNTRNTIAYATGQPKDFQEVYRAEVPADTDHWHYNAHREVKLPEPAERVYVRYVGDPALNNVHLYAHCLDDGRATVPPIRITHAWKENGTRKTKTVSLRGPGSYDVATDAEPENESVEIAVASDGATP